MLVPRALLLLPVTHGHSTHFMTCCCPVWFLDFDCNCFLPQKVEPYQVVSSKLSFQIAMAQPSLLHGCWSFPSLMARFAANDPMVSLALQPLQKSFFLLSSSFNHLEREREREEVPEKKNIEKESGLVREREKIEARERDVFEQGLVDRK